MRAVSGPILVVAPLAAELAGVRAAAVPLPRQPGDAAGRGQRIRLGDLDVVLATTGDGAAAAAAGLEALVTAVRPRRLLVLGVGGGLTPGLAFNTLVAARRVVAEDGTAPALQPDRPWLAQALACGAVGGTVLSTARIVGDPPGKRRALAAARALAAGPGEAVTVDLESAAYARVAAAHSLPYLVVRAVLDPAEETLPLDFEACRTAGGGVSNARVVLRALARPAVFRDLWRLRTRLGQAARRLGAFAEMLAAATLPPGGRESVEAPPAAAAAAAAAPATPATPEVNAFDAPSELPPSSTTGAALAGRRRA